MELAHARAVTWWTLPRIAVVALGLACALYVHGGRYPMGLDFEGGAIVTVAGTDTVHEQIALEAGWRVTPWPGELSFDRRNATEDEQYALEAQLTAAPRPAVIRSHSFIGAAHPLPARAIAVAAALGSALAWLLAFWLRRAWPAVLAAAALGWVVAVADRLYAGSTYSIAVWFTGALWILPLAAFAWCAGRAPARDLARRGKAVLPAAALLLVAIIASLVVAATRTSTLDFMHLVKVGLAYGWRAAPAIAVTAVLVTLATPGDALKS